MQHIDRNWYYVAEIQESLREKITIKEAQKIMAENEKPIKQKNNWYLTEDNIGSKEGIKPDYWSWE